MATNGSTGPLGFKNGYNLESSKKCIPRATRLAKNKSYPFWRDKDPGTPVNGYVTLGFQLFSVIFGLTICL